MAQYLGLRIFKYAHFTLKSPWDKCEMCILEDTKPQILSQFELILAHYPSSFATDWLKMAQYLGLRIFKYAHFTLKSPWDKCEMCILEDTKPQILSQFELILAHYPSSFATDWLKTAQYLGLRIFKYAHFTLKSPWDKCEMCILEDTKPQILSQFELILAHYPSSFSTDWLILAQYLGLRIFKYAHFTLKSPWDKCEMCILEDTKPQILSQFELILAHYPSSFSTDWLILAHYPSSFSTDWLILAHYPSSFSTDWLILAQYLGLRIFKYAHFTLKSPWDKCEMCILEDTKPQILSQFELILAHYPSSFSTDWLILAHYPSSFSTDWLILAHYPSSFSTDWLIILHLLLQLISGCAYLY